MTGRDFLPSAHQLAAGGTEAAWRTAVSRAYYAAFHCARELLENMSFRVPRADLAHKYLIFRLSNCGDTAEWRASLLILVTRRSSSKDRLTGFGMPK